MSYFALIMADTPQAYFRLGEASGNVAFDVSGNGYNAQLSGVAAFSQPGAIAGDSNGAIAFTANGGITVPPALASFTFPALSVEFWIQIASIWHHVVLTTNDSAITTYIDNQVVSPVAQAALFGGQLFDIFGMTQAATLDEIAVYNYALSATQISNHFAAASGFVGQAYGTDLLNGGARGNPNAWSPATDGQSWVQQAGAAVPSLVIVGGQTRGQLTGDTAVNVWYLGSRQFRDCDVYCRLNLSATTVNAGVLGRSTGVGTYYACYFSGSTFKIVLDNGGTVTTLASQAGATYNSNTYYWLHFRIQGFGSSGSNTNNLLANLWLDPNHGSGTRPSGEPAGWMLSASNSTLYLAGDFGIYYDASATTQTATFDSFTCTDCPPPSNFPVYNTVGNRPYGNTLFLNSNVAPLSAQQISDMVGPNSASSVGFGNGCHLRYQIRWQDIETTQGYYDWGLFDDAVQQCNYNGIRFFWSVADPPAWWQSVDAFGSNASLTAATQGKGSAYSAANAPTGGYTSINVTALPQGAFIPHGYQLTVNYGGSSAETLFVWNPSATYTAGATTIGISTSGTSQHGWTPTFVHTAGEPVPQKNGYQFASPAKIANFAAMVATRYNSLSGYGFIEEFQVENENYDIQQRVQNQGGYNSGNNSPASWDKSSVWDNGGAVLAAAYIACRNAIHSVTNMATVPVFSCAVRKTPNTARQHVQNWMTGLISQIVAAGGTIDGCDFHYYRDSSVDWNGVLVNDPTVPTYTDSSKTTINIPTIAMEISDLQAIFATYGVSPMLLCGETGWWTYDDGNGPQSPTTAQYVANHSGGYTSLAVSATWVKPATIAAGSPISIDYTNPLLAEIVYAYGTQASGATTLQITTDPTGSTQVAWVPLNTHAIGATVYGIVSQYVSPQLYATYLKSMFDAMRTGGANYCFVFTDDASNTTVKSTVYPPFATRHDNVVYTINGTYTYEPAYYTIANDSAIYPTWQQQSSGGGGGSGGQQSTANSGGNNQNLHIYKQQMVFVYSSSGTFLDVWRDAPMLAGFKEAINDGTAILRVQLPRSFDNFDQAGAPGSRGTVAQGNVVKYYLYGPGLPTTGLLRYQGIIDSYEPQIADSGEESVVVNITPFSSILGDRGNTGYAGTVFGTVGNSATYVDPVTMFNYWFTTNDPNTSHVYTWFPGGNTVTLDASNPTSSGVKLQYLFVNQTLKQMFDTIIQMLPANWFYRYNMATNTFTLNVSPGTAQHTLYVGQHLSNPQYMQDWTPLQNVAYFLGGVPAGSTFQTPPIESVKVGSDITIFGERIVYGQDSRVTDPNSAAVLAQGLLTLNDHVFIRGKMRVPDYRGSERQLVGYDIETFKVGDTIQIIDPLSTRTSGTQPSLWDQSLWDQSYWDGSPGLALTQVAQIIAIDYYFDYVDLEIGYLQPSQDRQLVQIRQQFQDFTMI